MQNVLRINGNYNDNRDTFVSNLYCRRQNWFNTIYLIYSSGYLILKGFKNKLDGRFNSHCNIFLSFYLNIVCKNIVPDVGLNISKLQNKLLMFAFIYKHRTNEEPTLLVHCLY